MPLEMKRNPQREEGGGGKQKYQFEEVRKDLFRS